MGASYRKFSRQGVVFVFKVDPADAGLLHIYVRHLKQPEDAVRVWLAGARGDALVHFNPAHDRFETYLDGVGVYWFWIVERRVVMVVSCFDVLE